MSEIISASYCGQTHSVPLDDVTHFQADCKYVIAHYPGGELILDEPLCSIERRLGERVIRIHRSTLASARHLRAICPLPDDSALAMLEGVERPLPVSRRSRRSAVKALAIKTGSRFDAR